MSETTARIKLIKKEQKIEKKLVDGEMPSDRLPPYEIYVPLDYRDGPEGFIKWCEDNVHIPIYPEGVDIPYWTRIGELPRTPNRYTGRSYWTIWDEQKNIFRQCLRMVNGRFIYRLIILCWMRGEGKSLAACLIQLWKLFNWPRQLIVLGANSKEQIRFVHFDIMRDIILNSPKLLEIVGFRNIHEKEIRIRDEKGNIGSRILPISSFTGIVSNITGYTFSEMFDMKNPKFFTQLDGSTRNIPNALGVIDSTVSAKTHVLYDMYTSFMEGKSRQVYYSYRFSRKGEMEDFWNPNMDQIQLDDYRVKFPLADYERYFMNIWGGGSEKVFTDAMIEAIGYIGLSDDIGNKLKLIKTLEQIYEVRIDGEKSQIAVKSGKRPEEWIAEQRARLIPVDRYYSLKSAYNSVEIATVDELNLLGDLYNTDWAVGVGIDRADPMKQSKMGARTIFTCIGKGLPGSRNNLLQLTDPNTSPYIYIMLYFVSLSSHSLEDLKELITACHNEYNGVDAVCGERWGLWDLMGWCEEQEIKAELVHPTYDKQRAAFTELYMAISQGRFKCPSIPIMGYKEDDVLREELSVFNHDVDKRWFGSPEKVEKGGIQDDTIFSTGWCMYGMKDMSLDTFRARNKKMWFGDFVPETGRLVSNRDW